MAVIARALRHAALAGALLLATLGGTGCAGHESRVRAALDALDRGSSEGAVAALDTELGVTRPEDAPPVQKDEALLLLDRGSVLLGMEKYKLSARDLGVADKAIETLDLSTNAVDSIGQYVFSDDAGPYRAPAYEKLLINTLNLMNYLALHDLEGARVEARRHTIMQRFVRDQGDEGALLGLGNYLAGFAFEQSRNREEALLHYDDALRYAQYGSLRDALRTLTPGVKKLPPGVAALVNKADPLPSTEEAGEGEIVVVLGFGRVPQKIPVRIPIGMALEIVGSAMNPGDRARANELAAQGLVTWVNYPTLGPGRGSYEVPSFVLDDKPQPLEQALDVEKEVRDAWYKREGTIVLSAVTRMLTRMAAGAVVQGVTQAAASSGSGEQDPQKQQRQDQTAAALGLLLGLATTATLSALDTPDTRSWSTLPARIAVGRIRVPAGAHKVKLSARGETRTFDVKVAAGDWAFLPMMVLR
jgi:hypothetical protein